MVVEMRPYKNLGGGGWEQTSGLCLDLVNKRQQMSTRMGRGGGGEGGGNKHLARVWPTRLPLTYLLPTNNHFT